ncbi:MAG: hypothetical protein AAFQ77_03295 [Myxococcota bacterium]
MAGKSGFQRWSMSQTPGSARAGVVLASLAVLAHLLIPMRYYSDPGRDERFAWRMFSPQRYQDGICRVELSAKTADAVRAPLPAKRFFRGVWLAILGKGHPELYEAALDYVCQQGDAMAEVGLMRRCWNPDGSPHLYDVVERHCASGEMELRLGNKP